MEGQTLSASTGSWGDDPSSYAYQWQHCTSSGCTSIAGATAATYTLQSSDVGDTADVVVTASDVGGTGTASSAKTAVIAPDPSASMPANTAPPEISGNTFQGQALTASHGAWNNSPTSYTYQWQDCTTLGCSDISGATGSSYTLQSSDVADKVAVVVTANNGGGSGTATSAPTGAVAAFVSPPVNTEPPTITGTAAQGQALTASHGTWSDAPTSYGYQWQDCTSSGCTNVTGATGSSYTLQSSDVGDTIAVVVSASNGGGSGTATSAPTTAVAALVSPPVNTELPTVSGTATQGQALTASHGAWTNSPTSYRYQWQDCTSSGCTNINGATGSGYTLQSSDVGDTVAVVVSASNGGGSGTATSAPTGAVAAIASPPANTEPPTVGGTTTQGQALTASHGTWSNAPISYSYQWQDCTSSGCSEIAGANTSSYVLQSTDVGDSIDVVVTAINSAGSSSATSPRTAVVASNSSGTTSSLPGNPPSTASGVSPGLPATTSISSCCGSLLTASPPATEVWDWNRGNPSAYPCPGTSCIYKGVYFPADRQYSTRYGTACNNSIAGGSPSESSSSPTNTPCVESLHWYETVHPDWVEYQCAASSVSESAASDSNSGNATSYQAFYSSDPYSIPLDTANSSVISWEEQIDWGPTLATGNYQHIDFDNFDIFNSSGGDPCGHYDTSGTWVAQYSGSISDPAWASHEINLAAALESWVHADYRNVAMAGNLTSCDPQIDGGVCTVANQENLLSHLDLWFDEQGFTWGNSCSETTRYTHSDIGLLNSSGYSSWTNKATLVQYVTGRGKGWQDINQVCGGQTLASNTITGAQKDWALANYLLFKNSTSWVYVSGNQEYGMLGVTSATAGASEYQNAAVGAPTDSEYQNQGVYRRDFTSGLALVNPSDTTSYTVRLPAGTWTDLAGNTYSGSVTLSAATAIVLHS